MDTSDRWTLGWALGALVVVIAAGLLLTIIGLARRIVRQADEIEAGLKEARENTVPLFDIATTNLALDRAARELRALRGQR